MKLRIATMMLLAAAVAPLTQAQPEPMVQKIFQIKYVDPSRLASMLAVFPCSVKAEKGMKLITVNGPQATVDAIEQAIKRFDVPPPPERNIELTVYFLIASPEAAAGAAVPTALEAVVRQMKSTFSFQGFRLLDTLILRAREGRGGDASGIAAPTSAAVGPNKTFYHFKFNNISISGDKERVIRLDNLRMGARIPYVEKGGSEPQYRYADTGFNTDIDIREGQKVVVGKSSLDGSAEAMVLVVTAKVVE